MKRSDGVLVSNEKQMRGYTVKQFAASGSKQALWVALCVLTVGLLACSLPGMGAETPAPQTPPTQLPATQAPATQAPATQPPPTTAPATAAPPTPTTAPVTSGPYQVAFVADNDVLNVRSGPGISNPAGSTLAYNATDIMITGAGQEVSGSTWVPVQKGSQTGWVNRSFLTEQVTPATFCADARVTALLENLKAAISGRDGAALAELVHPARGLLIRHNWWNPEVRLSHDEVSAFFTDSRSRDWGVQDGSGLPLNGSSAAIILPMLDEDLLNAAQTDCDELLGGNTAGIVTLPAEYSALNFLSVYRPAPDEENPFDWGSWAIGVEFWEGRPFLAFLVHYEWEI